MAKQRFLVLSNAICGREAEYVHWYVTRHVHDMTALDHVLDGQFLTVSSAEAKWRHIGLYTIADGMAQQVLTQIDQIRGSPSMVLTEALDRESLSFLIVELMDEHSSPQQAVARFRHIVLSAPLPGGQDEMDHWLAGQHSKDMLSVPGICGAEHLRIVGSQGGKISWTRGTCQRI